MLHRMLALVPVLMYSVMFLITLTNVRQYYSDVVRAPKEALKGFKISAAKLLGSLIFLGIVIILTGETL